MLTQFINYFLVDIAYAQGQSVEQQIFGTSIQGLFLPPKLRPGGPGVDNLSLQTIALEFISYYTTTLLNIAAFIALCYIIYGGYKMLTAFGDEAKYAGGKKTLQYAAIGLLISLLARLIIYFFVKLLGGNDSIINSLR